jgi:hypothetical protein
MNLNSIFAELQQLQVELQEEADRLWSLRSELAAAYRQGHREGDFLPRRLMELRLDAQKRFDRLTNRLSLIVSTRLDSIFLALSSPDDVKAVQGIRKTIRYIRNAFAAELCLGAALARLQQAGPAA